MSADASMILKKWEYPQPCEYGGFCVEGMCDDPQTCWSGEIEDQYEGGSGSETSPTLVLSGPQAITRTLFRGGAQDYDWNRFLVPDSLASTSYVLGLKVHNHCFDPSVDTDPLWMDEVSVRVWYLTGSSMLAIPKYLVGGDSEWVTPHRWLGIIQPLDATDMAEISNLQKKVFVEIKNSDNDADRREIPYTLEVKMKSNPYPDFSGPFIHEPGTITLGVLDSGELSMERGEAGRFTLSDEVIERGGRVVIEPRYTEEGLPRTTVAVLRDRFGEIPREGHGVSYETGINAGSASRAAGRWAWRNVATPTITSSVAERAATSVRWAPCVGTAAASSGIMCSTRARAA